MSKNKVKLFTKNTQTGVVTPNISKIELLGLGKNKASGVAKALSIKEINSASAHVYALSATSYVSFTLSIENKTNQTTYYWNLDSSPLQQEHAVTKYDTNKLNNTELDFKYDSINNTFSISIIGNEDIRMNLVNTNGALVANAQYGFKLVSTNQPDWIQLGIYY